MKIVADLNMPALEDTFALHGELVRVAGRSISRADLLDADVLLVRSVTSVNAALLQDTSVRFVGSATIGVDHLDTEWLEQNNIAWAHAPGCNADAAAQYTLAMMWLACERLGRDFGQQRVGIIGRGNVGRRLEHLLKALNIPVMCCDPPLQDQGERHLVDLQQACANTIISLHVPLTHTGKYPSKDLFERPRLASLEPGTLLVNASRGGVIEAAALLAHLQSGHINAALDVWPQEPYIAPQLLDLVTVASPHIAGYSAEGKRAGTEMIYQAFCRLFATEISEQAIPEKMGTHDTTVTIEYPAPTTERSALQQLVYSSCPVLRDDATLRVSPDQFDQQRSTYPQRHEFKSYFVTGVSAENASLLNQMGFKSA